MKKHFGKRMLALLSGAAVLLTGVGSLTAGAAAGEEEGRDGSRRDEAGGSAVLADAHAVPFRIDRSGSGAAGSGEMAHESRIS